MMSLANLNKPSLIASAGAAALAVYPSVEALVASVSITWPALKIATAVAYAAQVAAVSVPGRIDDEVARAIQEEDGGGDGGEGSAKASEEGKRLSPGEGRTLVAPAGWAFAIWGPIFAGELVFVASQLSTTPSDTLVPLLKRTNVPFIFAHVFQSLWCASFRKKYSGNLMYVSFGMLSLTAYSLGRAHSAFASDPAAYGTGTYLKMFLPISMHFGWTVAASLVNLNAAFTTRESASPRAVAMLGHASVVAATAIGAAITINRSAPVFGGVIVWALLAVADGMRKRLERARKDDGGGHVHGAQTQRRLCLAGAAITGLIVLRTALSLTLN